jgi:hypothetical protein
MPGRRAGSLRVAGMIASCTICSHPFTARRSTARYCSARCRQTAHRRDCRQPCKTLGIKEESGAADVRFTGSPIGSIVDAGIQPSPGTSPLRAAAKRPPSERSTIHVACYHLIPDQHWPGMWRILLPSGRLLGMLNKSRATDALARIEGRQPRVPRSAKHLR